MPEELVELYLVVTNFDSEARRKLGESARRAFYNQLERYCVLTPIGWVTTPELSKQIIDYAEYVNQRAGKKVVEVVKIYLPKQTVQSWMPMITAKESKAVESLKKLVATV